MRRVALVLAGIVVAACVEKGPEADPNFVKANLLTAAEPKFAVNADLGGKVVYLGADAAKTTIRPGDEVKIVHYWKVVEAPGSEWRIFSHLDGLTKRDWMNIDASKMREQYGPAKWKAGDIVRDEQIFQLRKDWASPFATVHVGLYKKGSSSENDRLPIVSGPSAPGNRVVALKLQVTGVPGGAVAALPRYSIPRAVGAITIDGKADEASWATAKSSGPFTDAAGGPALGQATEAKLLWDDKFLYAFIRLADKDVYSSYSKNDETIWKEDVAEIFIDADGNRQGYVELQVNPNNAQFDSWFARTRSQGGGDVTWNAGLQSAVAVKGTRDDRDDTDEGWAVEMAIPLEAVKGRDAGMAVTLPPKPGDKWRLNVVRVEKGQKQKGLSASSWSPITIADFHAIDRLLEATFADEKGEVPTAAVVVPDALPVAPMAAPSAHSATVPAKK